MKKSIAILGATSHIAKGIIFHLSDKDTYDLALYARDTSKMADFVNSIGHHHTIYNISAFGKIKHDVVINCIGIGDPAKLEAMGSRIFTITEQYDNMVEQYLLENPACLYINFSSGAAYGYDFTRPVNETTMAQYSLNNIGQTSYYGLSKLYSEAKHRSLRNLNIVDLRVFGYYSRFIDLTAKFLLTEIIMCLKNETEFITGPGDITRDYVSPEDLTSLVINCIESQHINDVFDVYSLQPVTKFETIRYFQQNYGLRCKITTEYKQATVTGTKDNYYSLNKRAEKVVNYVPRLTALECVARETLQMNIP